jgi:surface antigen
MSDDKPCCAADALSRIRQVKINRIMTGITMLDECIAEVRAQNYGSETEIRAALLKKIRIYNYVPKGVEEEYAWALMEEYKKSIAKK